MSVYVLVPCLKAGAGGYIIYIYINIYIIDVQKWRRTNMKNPWPMRIPITKKDDIVNSHLAPETATDVICNKISSNRRPGAPCMSLTLSGALRTFQVTNANRTCKRLSTWHYSRLESTLWKWNQIQQQRLLVEIGFSFDNPSIWDVWKSTLCKLIHTAYCAQNIPKQDLI